MQAFINSDSGDIEKFKVIFSVKFGCHHLIAHEKLRADSDEFSADETAL